MVIGRVECCLIHSLDAVISEVYYFYTKKNIAHCVNGAFVNTSQNRTTCCGGVSADPLPSVSVFG